jgi:hypothetical protein
VFPHPYNRPNHAPHLFLAKPQHFAHHAAHPTPPASPAHQCSEQVVVYKTTLRRQRAFPNPMRKNPCVLYPLASFLYRASLMMAMNRIANSDGSSRSGANES